MKRRAGYTLLEMLVVVFVLAMATAMVAPAGFRMIRTWQQADDRRELSRRIAQLPLVARDRGEAIVFPPGDYAGTDPALPLPADWRLHFESELRVGANGACGNSSGVLDTGAGEWPLSVIAPFCRADLGESAQ